MEKKIELNEVQNGFSHRDLHSKAILNSDKDSLLKYKIQKNRMSQLRESSAEVETIKQEMHSIKSEIQEIKNLLLQITAGRKWQ